MTCRDCIHWTDRCWQHPNGMWATYGEFGPGYGIKGKCKLSGEPQFELGDACEFAKPKGAQRELFE